jgi:hypothetical protein
MIGKMQVKTFIEIRDFFKSQINTWKQLEEAVTVQFQANKSRLVEHNPQVLIGLSNLTPFIKMSNRITKFPRSIS